MPHRRLALQVVRWTHLFPDMMEVLRPSQRLLRLSSRETLVASMPSSLAMCAIVRPSTTRFSIVTLISKVMWLYRFGCVAMVSPPSVAAGEAGGRIRLWQFGGQHLGTALSAARLGVPDLALPFLH